MDLYNHLVTEVLLSEVSTKGWKEFEKKYLPLADRKDLFVQFTKFAGNTEDKRSVGTQIGVSPAPPKPEEETIGNRFSERQKREQKLIAPDMTLWTTPNHKDPAAIYTYPLEYVVNHPTSIPYGAQSPFLRVVKLRPGAKVLDLQTVTKEMALKILRTMGAIPAGMDEEKYWEVGVDIGKSKFSPHPATAPKVFFLLAQSNPILNQEFPSRFSVHGSRENWNLETLSNNDQTKRFLKAGIQVVMDTAKTQNVAVIHTNEPEQAFFMDRSAFDIVDVFEVAKVPKGSYHNDYQIVNYKRVEAKVISKILSYLDPKDAIDKTQFVTGGLQTLAEPLKMTGVIDLRSPSVVTTRRGRAISIDAKREDRDIKDEGAYHRSGSRHLDHSYEVVIYSEHGVTDGKVGKDEELDPAARRIAMETRQKEREPEWRPVHGLDKLGEEWRDVLKIFPGTTRKGSFYKIDIDGALQGAAMVCERLQELMKTVGWKWEAPTDPWERSACWVAANKLYHAMLTRDRLVRDYSRGRDQLGVEADSLVNEPSYAKKIDKEAKKFGGTPVEHAARALIVASSKGYAHQEMPHLVGLIHGLEFCFQKRWAAMMVGAYPNFSTDIGTNIQILIADCTKDHYEERLKRIWNEIGQAIEPLNRQKEQFWERTGEHIETWGLHESVNEVIIGTKFSIDTPNSGQSGGAMPTVWKDPSKEASFSAPSKKGTPNPVMAKAKADVEKIIKRHLTWIRDPSSGSETAYIGHGRKVRIGLRNLSAGPMVIPLRADRMPANLKDLL